MLDTGSVVHAPSEVAPRVALHTSHPPEHAVPQQMLSEQKPDWH